MAEYDEYGPGSDFVGDWLRLMDLFDEIHAVRSRVPQRRAFLAEYRSFLKSTSSSARNPQFLQALAAGWTLFSLSDPTEQSPMLLRSEARAIVYIDESPEANGYSPASVNGSGVIEWKREVNAKDKASALKIFIGSLREALGFLPGWAQAIIKAVEEALEVLTHLALG